MSSKETGMLGERMVEAMLASDAACDGRFVVGGVKTTGIYCLPSCGPPTKPKPENCEFLGSAEEARGAGFRACKLCRPDGFYPGRGPAGAPPRRANDEKRRYGVKAYVETIDSPVGCVHFAAGEDGALLGLKFDEGEYPITLEQSLEQEGYVLAHDPDRSARVREELAEYFAGERRSFGVRLVLRGSDFQKRVWEELTRIPYGETRTYAEVAAAVGRPTAARAVGRANATNKIPLVVPCHRVIGANGSLTGFAGGTHLKVGLLAYESGAPVGRFDETSDGAAPAGSSTGVR